VIPLTDFDKDSSNGRDNHPDSDYDMDNGLGKAQNSLSNASGWGVVDVLGGGLLTTALKHSNISDPGQRYVRLRIYSGFFSRN
jgi:hypothetical protein